MGDSVKGGWHCPGRIVPPSPRRVLTRADLVREAATEAHLNVLFGWLDDPTAWPWRRMLERYDADHPTTTTEAA